MNVHLTSFVRAAQWSTKYRFSHWNTTQAIAHLVKGIGILSLQIAQTGFKSAPLEHWALSRTSMTSQSWASFRYLIVSGIILASVATQRWLQCGDSHKLALGTTPGVSHNLALATTPSVSHTWC